MARRYFWLKLPDDFFRQKPIKKLRKIAGGDTFTIIYLKMLLVAMKQDNKLYFDGVESEFAEELALDLDEDEENVSLTLTYLKNQGLLVVSDDTEFTLPQCAEMTGSECASAERVRRHRTIKTFETLQCNADVTEAKRISNGEIEKEKEKEKEIELDIYSPVIDYLNQKAGTSYRASSRKTRDLIKARVNEGFSEDDFKRVIDNKVSEWGREPAKGEKDMRPFLRPETLFGTKFEGYLNQKGKSKAKQNDDLIDLSFLEG